MDFFKQFRLLLKHRILLRRRQPTTLVLELFWPAFVFLTILITRWQFAPTFRQTCYYNPKALPSSGIINFMQSYICDKENRCLNRTDYQEIPSYPNASIDSVVDQVLPLLTNDNITKVINDLPKGIRLIAALIDTLSKSSVQQLLQNGLPLKSMLRPAAWKLIQQKLAQFESNSVPIYDLDSTNLFNDYDEV
ncbi:ATP-binding cassette sub-family A member 7 [Sarcoptes scabiei]|uniref:ATP-binding cassette sub-family A member 7 n=1 Tax=Sarcoptes scabiei TaxID=52283 RepID=A0A834R3A2_SARSC|nr:ATP-binding cassette sub-family A member 7 [Sarcoptes scabiei]